MESPSRRAGATLPELLILLSLFAILLAMSVSVTASARDGLAVRSARDDVAAGLGRASALARLHGSARAWIDGGMLRIEAPAGIRLEDRPIAAQFGVQMAVDGAAGAVALEFDGLGLGRLANRTLRFRRNGAEAGLTLSSYGRPRRW